MDPVAAYIRSLFGGDDANLTGIDVQGEELDGIQPSVGEEAGRFLALLVGALRAKRALELGTSLGYSAVWLGRALRATGGTLTSIEYDEKLFLLAKDNLTKAGLSNVIELEHGDAAELLEKLSGPYDIILQDCDKRLYPRLLGRCVELTRRGGIIVADDTLFKPRGVDPKFSDPVDEYNRLVFADERLYSTILPIGDGLTVSLRL
jgi:predicted O-methyltransferase YrrM